MLIHSLITCMHKLSRSRVFMRTIWSHSLTWDQSIHKYLPQLKKITLRNTFNKLYLKMSHLKVRIRSRNILGWPWYIWSADHPLIFTTWWLIVEGVTRVYAYGASISCAYAHIRVHFGFGLVNPDSGSHFNLIVFGL
jgi:hypothetical protein